MLKMKTAAVSALALAGAVLAPGTASADREAAVPKTVEGFVCTVRTIGVPVYDKPPMAGGQIKKWVDTGQKITVTQEWYYHWGTDVWGLPGGGWIHPNYLTC